MGVLDEEKDHMKTIGIAVVPPWRTREHLDALPVLCREAGITDLGYMIQCHPESQPLMEKINDSVARFERARDVLRAEKIGIGILLQTTVNHGDRYQPLSSVGFQRIVGHDGKECPACYCPTDRGFLEYMFSVAERLAGAAPDFLLVDDDFRLSHHQPADFGCFCDRHLELFAEAYGKTLPREALVAGMAGDGAEGIAVRSAWLKVRERSYLDFCSGFRKAIDRVNPTINAGYCNVRWNGDITEKTAAALAGANTPFVRLNAGVYMNASPARFAGAVVQTAALRASLPDEYVCLSEADTCPHNRYSLSAKALRAYIVGTLLAGVDGPKLWIANCREWYLKETDRYRRVVGSSGAYFDEVLRLSKSARWQGAGAPHRFVRPATAPWRPETRMWNAVSDSPNWAGALLARFGVPWTIRDDAATVMLAGDMVHAFDDAEVDRILSRAAVLDGKAASILCARGFAQHIGVRVETGDLLRFNYERFSTNREINREYAGTSLGANAAGIPRLVPIDEAVQIASTYVAVPFFQSTNEEAVAPALTLYENEKGGRVAVYARIPAFGVLAAPDDRTKEQLIGVLSWTAKTPPPVWTVGTADVLVRYGTLNADTHVLAVINMSSDEIEPLVLSMPGASPERIEALGDDGSWADADFSVDGDTVQIYTAISNYGTFVARVTC